jgi:hypothetical protein
MPGEIQRNDVKFPSQVPYPAFPAGVRIAEPVQQHQQRRHGVALILVMNVKPAWKIHEVRSAIGVFRFQSLIRNVGTAQLQPRGRQRHRDYT